MEQLQLTLSDGHHAAVRGEIQLNMMVFSREELPMIPAGGRKGTPDEQALQELERAANEAVWADFAPHIWYPEPDELAHLPYRSKKALTGAVRLVQFRDIDCAPAAAPMWSAPVRSDW